MQHVFCISGLGADERIFQKLELGNIKFHHVNWIRPEKGEPLDHYAKRLMRQIDQSDPIILGVSFGGMMAIEIAKQLQLSKLILIASVKSRTELPTWMKTCGQLGLPSFLPARPLKEIRPLKLIRPIQNYFLGAHSAEEKKIANEFRDNVDPVYLKWSISQVVNWKNDWVPENIYHIHGDRDHIFPIKNIKPTHVIPNGGHFMIMNQFSTINSILRSILAE